MRQATAYVDVDKSPSSYDVFYDQEYEVFTDEKKVCLTRHILLSRMSHVTSMSLITRDKRDVDVIWSQICCNKNEASVLFRNHYSAYELL